MQTIPDDLKKALIKLGTDMQAGILETLPIEGHMIIKSDIEDDDEDAGAVFACAFGAALYKAFDGDLDRYYGFDSGVSGMVKEAFGYDRLDDVMVFSSVNQRMVPLGGEIYFLNDAEHWPREKTCEWVLSLPDHPEWIIELPRWLT